MGKVGVSQEEKNLAYYKYFEQDLAPIPAEKLALLESMPTQTCISFNDKDLFLAGKDTAFCQVGYGINADGIGFVCNETYMPGVTGEMLDWWFPWHSVGSDLRYKIWDPEDHYFATADRVDYVCNPNVPMNEKTWGVTHYIMEDVGPGPELLQLRFMAPADFGFDQSLIGTEKCQSLVCAAGLSSVSASMVHKWYPYESGVMFCSRFWIGYGYIDGKMQRGLPEGARIPDMIPKGLYAHNIKEFSNLAAILPSLYAEQKDNL